MAEKEQVYHSQNFKPNKKKVEKPPYLCYFLIIIYSLYILLPLYIIVITSFKSHEDATSAVFIWWPRTFSVEAYTDYVWKERELIFTGLMNTLLYFVPRTIISLIVNIAAAYGFCKLQWRGKEAIFGFLMLTMMIPGSITMTASRMYMAMLQWDSTWYPLVIPGLFGGIGTVFFLRQYVAGIPDDLLGAARIDGMSEFNIFFSLIIPLSMPALTTQAVLGFIGAYNDYMSALIYLGNYQERWTIQLVLKQAIGLYPNAKYAQMAFCTVGMAPLIILYLIMQDYILKGISMSSGLKG